MPSICPGCSIGCGLYIEEREGIRIDYRKRSPVNQGKLCKFGVQLDKYYLRKVLKPRIDGKEVKLNEAISEVGRRLKSFNPDEIAFLSFGDTTNEELLAFREAAESFGSKNIDCGFGKFFGKIPEKLHPILKLGIPFEEIRSSKRIVLLLMDLYTAYPLLVRQILLAKKGGAEVTEVTLARTQHKIANEVIEVDPSNPDIPDFDDSLIIADLNPNTPLELVKNILSMRSKVLFMKPFLNSTGALHLGLVSDDIIEGIENERIKALYLLESDPIWVFFDEERIKSALSDLDLLIVQNSLETPVSEIAHIAIPGERFFEKRGTIVNIEGRILENGGKSMRGIEIIGNVSGKDFDGIYERVMDKLGISAVKEDEIPLKRKEGEIFLEKEKIPEKSGDFFLVYRTSPSFWRNFEDGKFIEISVGNAQKLNLVKGDRILVKSDSKKGEFAFKVSKIPDNIVVSGKKLPQGKEFVSPVKIEKVE
ncbi:MAG: molybdopterin-dependent oxidoreductase [Candidatus Syntropharchaeia archaeon]